MSDAPRNTFDRKTAADKLAKLHREIADARHETDVERALDFTQNAMLDAWHLSEWIWKEIDRLGLGEDIVRARLNAPSRGPNESKENWFYRCMKVRAPDLDRLRPPTTEGKHGSAKPGEEQQTTTSGTAHTVSAEQGIPPSIYTAAQVGKIINSDDGVRIRAIDAAESVANVLEKVISDLRLA